MSDMTNTPHQPPDKRKLSREHVSQWREMREDGLRHNITPEDGERDDMKWDEIRGEENKKRH